jgi:hypothetical protein
MDGEKTGRKISPEVLADKMKKTVDSKNQKLFRPEEFLNKQQIYSCLSNKMPHLFRIFRTSFSSIFISEYKNFMYISPFRHVCHHSELLHNNHGQN